MSSLHLVFDALYLKCLVEIFGTSQIYTSNEPFFFCNLFILVLQIEHRKTYSKIAKHHTIHSGIPQTHKTHKANMTNNT